MPNENMNTKQIDTSLPALTALAEMLPKLSASRNRGMLALDTVSLAVHRHVATRHVPLNAGVTVLDTLAHTKKSMNVFTDLIKIAGGACAEAQQLAQENMNLAGVIDQLNKQFAKNLVRVPRPAFCSLLPADAAEGTVFEKLPPRTHDEFFTENTEESVLSRLRFQVSADGNAVGVVVLASDDTDEFAARNSFEFSRFVPVASSMLRRKINLDNPREAAFLYTTVVGYALNLADAAVTLFGPLSCSTVADGERSDTFSVASDTVSDTLLFAADPEADAPVVEPYDLSLPGPTVTELEQALNVTMDDIFGAQAPAVPAAPAAAPAAAPVLRRPPPLPLHPAPTGWAAIAGADEDDEDDDEPEVELTLGSEPEPEPEPELTTPVTSGLHDDPGVLDLEPDQSSGDETIARILAEADGPEEDVEVADGAPSGLEPGMEPAVEVAPAHADAQDTSNAFDPGTAWVSGYQVPVTDPDHDDDDAPVALPVDDPNQATPVSEFAAYANAGAQEPLDTTMDQDLAGQLAERDQNAPVAGSVDPADEDEIERLLREDEDQSTEEVDSGSAGTPQIPAFTVDPTLGGEEPGLDLGEGAAVRTDGGDADLSLGGANPFARFAE